MSRKKQIPIYCPFGIFFVVCAILYLSAHLAFAAAVSFLATGEYVASDFETPSVVEQRAFMRAKQDAAEQAAAYVAKRIRAANGKISKERSYAIAWNLFQETRRETHREALPGKESRILVGLTATLDDSAIDAAVQRPQKEQWQAVLMVDELQRTVERLDQDVTELKRNLAEAKVQGKPTEEIIRSFGARENVFLSLLDVDASCQAYEKKAYNEAIAACNAAIRLYSQNALAYSNRGVVYEDEGIMDKAMADFTRAIAMDMNCAAAYANRGILYESNSQHDRAISDLNRAIALAPNYAVSYCNRGLAYKGDRKSVV